MSSPRRSGVQLHVTSLPEGRLGDSARAFVDWLAAAGQSVWQLLPLSVPDEAGSPYKSPSAFACSPALLEHPDAPVTDEEVAAFAEREGYWLDSWTSYGGDVRAQVRFDREWGALRDYAAERGVRLMGDVPIYVAPDGADERAWPAIFDTSAVAGVPPDAYAETGQLWGNPLYRWDVLEAQDYRWWVERLRRTFALFDLVRLDHFRGFAAYWAVPADEETAMNGTWEPGPGRALFDAATTELGPLPVLAEDLGDIDQPVLDLRDALGYPGMAVLQFGFEPGAAKDPGDSPHEVANLVEHQVVYTATHDNDTTVGWWADLPRKRRRTARRLGVDPDDPAWSLVELAWRSPAELAMTQAQDLLRLGSEARMNTPGVEGGWRWRMQPGALTERLATELRALTEETGRA
ncbi:4-alpha-glucanotransferase [Marmoricola endophyticus]|uniref:4-alpha-glucanotransferase n=1 Tax=Marmoricola endophyticus TaxID=2040280 RepID=UPI001664D244|nr:4-alpha-glucanotransferase [Marmoricola endophyticus]